MAFTRRFTQFPGFNVISEIEGIVIVDLQPPQASFGVATGRACLVGEFLKGTYGLPTDIGSMQQMLDEFGGYILVSPEDPLEPEGSPIIPNNGNGFLSVVNKAFQRLAVVRADLRETVDGTAAATKSLVKITVAGAPISTTLTIPAGTRISDNASLASATDVWVTDNDYTIATDGAGAGNTGLTVNVVSIFGAGVTTDATPLFVNDDGWLEIGTATIGAGPTNHSSLGHLSLAAIDTRYETAIDVTLGLVSPNGDITVIWAARESDAIRDALQLNAETASQSGRGRVAVIRPPFDEDKATAIGAAAPGVGAYRSDRVVYAYPSIVINVPVAGGERTVGVDGFIASLINTLAPEENIGQETQLLSTIVRFATLSATPQGANFTISDYKDFKAVGIAAPIFDSDIQKWVIQSDTTTDLAKLSLKRRRMADFIQDSRRKQVAFFSKKLATPDRLRQIRMGAEQFYDSLLSDTNPALQRIEAYLVDDKSGNTPTLNSKGIYVFIEKVRMLASLDDIVLQTEIGESVEITEVPSA